MVADGDSGVGGGVTVQVRPPIGSSFSVQTNLGSTTVREFKVIVAQNSDISAEQQQLIYKGQILKDDQTLESYGLQADHTVHMVRGLPAVSTNTTGAANSGHSISTYLDIFDFELMRRHEYAGGLGYGPQPGSPTLSTTLSHSEIDELRELLRYRQAEIERLREMNQVQLQDNQVLGQQNRLNNLNGNSTNNNGDSPRLNYNSS